MEWWSGGVLEGWGDGERLRAKRRTESWRDRIMAGQNHGAMEDWRDGVVEWWSDRVMEYWSFGVMEWWGLLVDS